VIAMALLLGQFVLSFIAGCRETLPAGHTQFNPHTAVIDWLAHTEDSRDLMSCEALDPL